MLPSCPGSTAKALLYRHLPLASLLLLVFMLSACTALPQAMPSSPLAQTTADAAVSSAGDSPLAPVMLSIPTIQLETAIEPMGWAVTEINGERTTQWLVPDSAAGWHVNSAAAGAPGNLVLSGHQVQGDAVFAPLSLGDVVAGQEVLVEDEAGTVFIYQIVEVSDPIPAAGATEAETAQALAYLEPTDDAQLTLITGWPDFTTTHRIFARAELIGEQE